MGCQPLPELFNNRKFCNVAIFVAADGSKVTGETIINCFKRCDFQTGLSFTPNLQPISQEFEDLLDTLAAQDLDNDEFIDFMNLDNDEFMNLFIDVDTSEPTVDPSKVNWRKNCRSQCLAEGIGENSLSESVEH